MLLKLFPTLRSAQARLQKLALKWKIKFIGWVILRGGRPEKCYAAFTVKSDNVAHEVEISWLLFLIQKDAYVRGAGVDPAYLSDADITIGEKMYHLERDKDTLNTKDTRERLNVYKDCPNRILWVCDDMPRVREMIRLANGGNHYFTTFEKAVQNPHAQIWLGLDGDTYTLDRSAKQSAIPTAKEVPSA